MYYRYCSEEFFYRHSEDPNEFDDVHKEFLFMLSSLQRLTVVTGVFL